MPREQDARSGNATQGKNKPVHEQRIGAIKVTIWRNQTANGPMHNVNFVRLYKDGDVWKESTSFGRDDLLVLAKLSDLAHTWICTQADQAS